MAPAIKSVELLNQVKLQYIEQGDTSGIPVLLLHGYTDSWHSFERVLPYLPMSIHAFALSQRGHGDADRPVAGYGPGDFATDVASFINALDIGPVVLVGHSMGSFAGQRFTLDFPDRTLALVLVGSSTAMRGNPGWLELGEAVLKLTDPIDPSFVREFQESTLAQPVPLAFLDTVVQESLKVPARVWKVAWEALAETDFSGEVDRIQVPTLIAWGDQDALFPRSEQDVLVAGIADSRLVVHLGTGHGVHWEQPERFASELVTFIETVIR